MVMSQAPELDMSPEQVVLLERLERIERIIDDLRSDWHRDLGTIFVALRTIGKALDVKLELERLVDKLEEKAR